MVALEPVVPVLNSSDLTPRLAKSVVTGAVAGGLLLAVVSFSLSFAGLVDVAIWADAPPWLAWTVPMFIDGALLVYTAAILVFKARGESVTFSWTVVVGFTTVSIGANFARAVGTGTAHTPGDLSDWRTWCGAGVVALAPVAVFVATHTLARLLVPATLASLSSAPSAPAIPTDATVVAVASFGAAGRSRKPTAPIRRRADEMDHRVVELARKGLSQRAIADAVGLSKSSVQRILRQPGSVAPRLAEEP